VEGIFTYVIRNGLGFVGMDVADENLGSLFGEKASLGLTHTACRPAD
jgi:hypothetical protein